MNCISICSIPLIYNVLLRSGGTHNCHLVQLDKGTFGVENGTILRLKQRAIAYCDGVEVKARSVKSVSKNNKVLYKVISSFARFSAA